MKNQRSTGILEHGAAVDLYRNTLAEIPTLFGRLGYLSALRTHTGWYEHYGLSLIFGDEKADQALRASHEQTFAEWLRFGLEQQKADLDLYLSAFGADKRTVVETWIRLAPYRNLVPTSARKVEYWLYLTDLETLLELLKNEDGVSCPDRDA